MNTINHVLSWLLQRNSCLGFSGVVQRGLKSTYSKITGAGLYFLRQSPANAREAHTLVVGYDPGGKRKAGRTSEWGQAVSAAETSLKRTAFQAGGVDCCFSPSLDFNKGWATKLCRMHSIFPALAFWLKIRLNGGIIYSALLMVYPVKLWYLSSAEIYSHHLKPLITYSVCIQIIVPPTSHKS